MILTGTIEGPYGKVKLHGKNTVRVEQNAESQGMVTQIKSAQQIKMERLTGKKSPQHVFNSILCDMILRQGGTMIISGEDLKKIPYKATLKGDWDDVNQCMVIRVVMPEGTIANPDGIIVRI